MQFSPVVLNTLQFIDRNLNNHLTLDRVAANACYSKYHLNRLFAAETGVTIHKYIQQKRLESAACQLRHTRRPIIDIALEAGYQSQQAFTLAFRQYQNETPQAYRLRYTKAPRLDVRGANTTKGGLAA